MAAASIFIDLGVGVTLCLETKIDIEMNPLPKDNCN